MSNLKKGDTVVYCSLKLNDSLTIFNKVRDVVTISGKRGVVERVILEGHTNLYPNHIFRKATPNDLKEFEEISSRILMLHDNQDQNQHVSSFSGEEKIGYPDEIHAFKSAYHMAKRKGGSWVYYQCKFCGKFHIGKNIIPEPEV